MCITRSKIVCMIRVLVIDVDLCIYHICKKILIFNAFLSYNDITVFLVGVFSVHCILYYIYFALFSTYTYYVLCIKQINFKLYIYTVYIYYLGFQKKRQNWTPPSFLTVVLDKLNRKWTILDLLAQIKLLVISGQSFVTLL